MAYLAVKKFIRILRGITSKHHGDFYCLNGLHSFATEKCESHEKVCENKDFCNAVMPSENTKILTFNQCQKSDKAPFIFYADLECLIGKTDGYRNNPENSSTSKVGEHIPSEFSMSTISSFQNIENKHHVYRSQKKMQLFTKEQQESRENTKICCKEKFENKYVKDKKIL